MVWHQLQHYACRAPGSTGLLDSSLVITAVAAPISYRYVLTSDESTALSGDRSSLILLQGFFVKTAANQAQPYITKWDAVETTIQAQVAFTIGQRFLFFFPVTVRPSLSDTARLACLIWMQYEPSSGVANIIVSSADSSLLSHHIIIRPVTLLHESV